MPKTKKLKIVPHEILPKEIFVKILKKLSYNSIIDARSTCQQWKNIIDNFNILKVILSKYHFLQFKNSENLIIF